MQPDHDLFAWASSRPIGQMIDARERFLDREVAFLQRLLAGYAPPKSGGAPPVILATVRRARQAAQPGDVRPVVPARHEVSHGG